MRNLSFYQRFSQIFLRGILISLLPSLLYCSETMENGDHQAKSTVQVEPLLNSPIPTSNPPSSIGFMYSKILFYVDGEVPIEFPSHECVRVAHHVVESMKEEKPGLIPSYHSYNEQVEDSFQQFTDCIVSEAATFYNIDKDGLITLLNLFYNMGPNFLFWNPNAFKLWNDIMTSIRLKKDNVVSFIKEDYDKHILPQQIIPQYSTSGWLGLARHIKKMEEPISGWWIPLGNRLILLRNLPEERQHFYVSDHGFQEEVLYSTKKHLLIFTDEGRQEQLCSFLFWRFFAQLSRDDKELLKQQFFLLLHQFGESNHQRGEFLLYTLSLPESLFKGALERGRLDAPYFNVIPSIGSRALENDPSVMPLNKDEINIIKSIPPWKIQEYSSIFDITLERIRYRGDVQSPIYVMSLFGGNQGAGLSPFFTQINNIFSQEDAQRYRMFFILKEISKKLTSGLQEFLLRPFYCFGSREEGESYRGFSEAFDKYSKNKVERPAHQIAQEMRNLLRGNTLTSGSLYFLPNLVAAWFISEAARNEASILSSLMLLDLIESGVTLIDDEGHNRYEWKHTLVHPKKPPYSSTKVTIKDLYGHDIDLGNFDGMHPMAHGGSIADSKRLLTNGTNLSAVHQKEGQLIMHWLSKKHKNSPLVSNLHIEPQLISSTGTLNEKPDYKEIDRLLQAVNKPSSRMDSRLKRKWEYLQIIKKYLEERLSTLDNLLDTEIPIKQAYLKLAVKEGKIGPREILGWQLYDVDDFGNCFYDAIIHQMEITHHGFLKAVPSGTLPRDCLRLRIQGADFKDEEWAEDEQIDKFVQEFDVILAIIDTKNPEIGYVYYYLGEDGNVITHVPQVESPLPNKPIIRLAATGNHFLSVISEGGNS